MFQGVCWNFLRGQLGTAKLISEKKHIKVGESQKLATSDRVRVIRRSRQIFFGAPQLGFGLIKVIFLQIALLHHRIHRYFSPPFAIWENILGTFFQASYGNPSQSSFVASCRLKFPDPQGQIKYQITFSPRKMSVSSSLILSTLCTAKKKPL